MTEAIRQKCISLGCEFAEVTDSNGGFNIFVFIVNTLNVTCRPGRGPQYNPLIYDYGAHAPRNDNEIQEAFYNGWRVYSFINLNFFINIF